MKTITVLREDTGISFIAEVEDDELDKYMTRLKTIVQPDCHFIVAEARFINHIISAQPKRWSPSGETADALASGASPG